MRFDLSEVVIVLLAGIAIGSYLMKIGIVDSIENNDIKGYHCQPITTHSTLEDAKAQVERYQERVK